ncbi:MAG: DUF3267 domain-containing protein [Bacteroidales bacterium]|nr:DUF3267 domain-containing protein [Bacteroidales bacterium]
MDSYCEFTKEKLTIDIVRANIYGIAIMFPIALIYGIPYFLLWKEQFTIDSLKNTLDNTHPAGVFIGFSSLIIIMIAGIILHELIHGITWALFASKGFKSIRFGVLWKMLTPYCHCKEPLKVRHYILGAIMPAIILGIIPAVIALFTGSFGLLLFALLFTISAIGDFMIINLLRKERMDDLAEDHPSEAGCYIYRKNSVSPPVS